MTEPLNGLDDGEATVLSCMEAGRGRLARYDRTEGHNNALFLRPLDVHEHAVEPEDALFQSTGLVRNLTWPGWSFPAWFALHHDVKVDELVRERGHVVFETESVFADGVRSQNVVALALALTIQHNLVVRITDFKVDVEGPSRLYLEHPMRHIPRSDAYCSHTAK
jgi:hypothetical protein